MKDTSTQLERHEYLELEILNRVEKSPQLSHRMLAAHLNCNLRLTHALLKKLVGHGLLEVKKLNSRRWSYFLTPSGLAAKAHRTYHFFEFSMQFYQDARQRSSEICKEISESGNRTVAFIGCGSLAEIAYLGVTEWNLELYEVFGMGKNDFLGRSVIPITEASHTQADVLIDCIFNPEAKTALLNLDFGQKNLYRIFP